MARYAFLMVSPIKTARCFGWLTQKGVFTGQGF